MLIDDARREFARRTRRGLGNVLTYLVLWIALGIAGILLPEAGQVATAYVIGIAIFWPLNLGISRLLSIQLVIRNNPLSRLAGLVGALHLLFVPFLLGAAVAAPTIVPWSLGLLCSAQFLLCIWLYESLAYLFCAVGIFEVATIIGWLAPGASYVATPFAVGGILFITAIFVGGEIASRGSVGRRK